MKGALFFLVVICKKDGNMNALSNVWIYAEQSKKNLCTVHCIDDNSRYGPRWN